MTITRRHAGRLLANLLPAGALLAKTPTIHAVFRSSDQGATWQRSDQGLPANSRVNALAAFGNSVFAGTDAGIFLSRNAGKLWQPSSDTHAKRVIALAATGQAVYAGTGQQGLWGSHDDGSTWAPVSSLLARRIRSLLANAGNLYVGTDDGEVLLSRDGGHHWLNLRDGLPRPAQIFELAMIGSHLFAALYANGLYRWTDSEQRWEKAGTLAPLVLASAAGTLLAGQNPGGLHFSSDHGANWAPSAADLSGRPSPSAPVWALSASGNLALAGASTGIYLSKDQGRTWQTAQRGLPAECPGIAFLIREQYLLAGAIIQAPN